MTQEIDLSDGGGGFELAVVVAECCCEAGVPMYDNHRESLGRIRFDWDNPQLNEEYHISVTDVGLCSERGRAKQQYIKPHIRDLKHAMRNHGDL